jgi:hypothetical protein
MPRFTWGALPHVVLDPAYVAWLTGATTVVIDGLVDIALPPSFALPNATTVVPVDWEKNAVFFALQPQHFPNAVTVDFLSCRLCHDSEIGKFPRWVVPERGVRLPRVDARRPNELDAKPTAPVVTVEPGLRERYVRTIDGVEHVLAHKWLPRADARAQFAAYCATLEQRAGGDPGSIIEETWRQ